MSLSRDGWGVAYYQDHDVALFREPSAASDSPLVRYLESQGPKTTLAISHIRHATQGVVSLANTQPFVRELAGAMHMFAHNGDLAGIERSGLHVLTQHCDLAQTSVDGQGVSVAGGFQQVALVASFPLSAQGWRPLAEGEVLAISAGEVRGSRRASLARSPQPSESS